MISPMQVILVAWAIIISFSTDSLLTASLLSSPILRSSVLLASGIFSDSTHAVSDSVSIMAKGQLLLVVTFYCDYYLMCVHVSALCPSECAGIRVHPQVSVPVFHLMENGVSLCFSLCKPG